MEDLHKNTEKKQRSNMSRQERSRSLHAKGKKGNEIVEAAIVIPPFFIALILLISIIPFLTASEKAVYNACDEMRAEEIRAHFISNRLSLPAAWKFRTLSEENFLDNAYITDYHYLYAKDGTDDLISLRLHTVGGGKNPLGGISRVRFSMPVAGRAFTGKLHQQEADPGLFTREEESQTVYVFPESGKKYHNASCDFLHPAYEKVILNNHVRETFHACKLCGSKRMKNGEEVYCFFRDGRVYHRADCSAVKKNYITMDRKDAEEKGYTPCAVCGG